MHKFTSLKYQLPAKIIAILIIVFSIIYVISISWVKISISQDNIQSMQELSNLAKTTIESTFKP